MTSVTAGSFALSTGCVGDLLWEPVFNQQQFYLKKIKHLNLCIYFWLHCVFVAACGLSLVVSSWDCPLFAVHRLPTAEASLAAEHGL